jgi:tight adherence protein C
MLQSDVWRHPTYVDLLVMFGIVAMIACGAALIASTFPTRSEALAQRVNFAMPRSGSGLGSEGARTAPPLDVLLKLPSIGGGLSVAEHRQVIRLFSRFNLPPDRAVPCFMIVRLIFAAAFAALAAMAVNYFTIAVAHPALPYLGAFGAAAAGWLTPILLISRAIKRRVKAVASGLPNALELLVVCVEAGLSLEDGLQRVARELQESQPALSEELAMTWAEANILPDRTQALMNLADRIDNPSVRSVVSMLSQSLRFGTPLAQSLRGGATEMRNDQMTILEEKASRLPSLMTIPVMVFIMPTIFLIIGGPAALRLMDMFHR